MKLFIVVIIAALVLTEMAFAQCTCMGGAAVGGLTPIGGSANIGVLREGHLRASMFYRYGYGNDYFAGDSKTDSGRVVKDYYYQYVGINAGYGLTEDLTLELESGYFAEKMQDFFQYRLYSSGFSHVSLSAKYNIYSSMVDEWEYTAGLGARVPLNFTEDKAPQNILPSTGAFGLIVHSFLHKGYKSSGLHFFLINRAEFNAENSKSYLYGFSTFSSLLVSKSIIDNLSGALEVRNEYRAKDQYAGRDVRDSGSLLFVASPQISYKIDNFYFTALFDLPFYKYYNGKQLSNAYSLGLMLTWQNNLSDILEE